jgi:hypothetical protein
VTNREMAIRMAAATLEKILAGEEVDVQKTLDVLNLEIEVFELINTFERER